MEPVEEEDETAVSSRWVCEFCSHTFGSKQRLKGHVDNGACFGKGYLCMRCLSLWRTQSELSRHQASQRKCKKKDECTIQRTEKNTFTFK